MRPPSIAAPWRPLWWAVSEIGWVDHTLLDRLDAAPAARVDTPARLLARRLTDAGWVAPNRGRSRPPCTVVVTRAGRDALAAMSSLAPPPNVPAREMVRRALAAVLLAANGRLERPVVVRLAVEMAGAWQVGMRAGDVRKVMTSWHRMRWVQYGSASPGRLLITDTGRGAFNAVARATGERVPRQARPQDWEHDVVVGDLVQRLAASFPAVIGTLHIGLRTQLRDDDGPSGQRWSHPDGLVGLAPEDGPILVALEVERRARPLNLARRLSNYITLAAQRPKRPVRVLVVTRRPSAGRREVVAGAIEEARQHRSHVDVHMALTTPSGAPRQLAEWGIEPATPAFPPD